MDIDPHTIQQIITRIREQLRCPQCRKRMAVQLGALKVLGQNFVVMQMQCDACDAHIMLHATLRLVRENADGASGKNASTKLMVDIDEIKELKKCMEKCNGSFSSIFDTP